MNRNATAIAAAVTAAIATVIAAAPPASAEPVGTDDEQISRVIQDFATTWTDGDYETWSYLLCRERREDPRLDEAAFERIRAEWIGELPLGLTATVIGPIEFHDGEATAEIMLAASPPDHITFRREGSTWRWC